jgi:histone acetyltransferase (RNA polymerase elongator complex component)
MYKRHVTIPIFVPEMACPFRCIYCDQHLISGAKSIPAKEDVVKTIEKYLSTITVSESEIEVGFFGGSFTGIPIKQQLEYLTEVKPFIDKGIVQSIRISTRPDYISESNLHLLKTNNVKTIELGAQSLDNEVLKISKRGHTVEDVENASRLIKSFGFDLGLQMMIGLPGDNPTKSIATAKKIAELKADNTRIYPTIVIKGTYLEELYNHGEYKALSLEECISTLKLLIPVFDDAQVKILRVGLHPSKDLQLGAYIAGPFHPSLRELVETEIWKDKFEVIIHKADSQSNLIVSVSKKQFNFAIGFKSKNKKQLEDHFKSVKFIIDNNLLNKDFYVRLD